jgi:DNA transformation protein
MPVSSGCLDFVRDLLTRHLPADAPLRTKRMFGGVGIYAGELFFALVADDVLYLKVDDGNRPDFEQLGIVPFTYTRKDGRSASMAYYPPPPDALEDIEQLRPWIDGALAAARRAQAGKPAR